MCLISKTNLPQEQKVLLQRAELTVSHLYLASGQPGSVLPEVIVSQLSVVITRVGIAIT